jgi:TrmH family RNA methyltransferase
VELITSRQNERVKRVAELCSSARRRRESGLCVIHGLKLCAEAVRFGVALRELWLTREARLSHGAGLEPVAAAAERLYLMDGGVCGRISPDRSPQGIVAVAALPAASGIEELAGQPRLAALQAVQDPGNVGAIIRSAAAFGYGGVVLTGDCADPFSPKALRASMGAVFGTATAFCRSLAEALGSLKALGHLTVAAALGADAGPLDGYRAERRLTLAIGSEGRGLSQDVLEACARAVTIPVTDRVESLNAAVAAGIAMWEMRL